MEIALNTNLLRYSFVLFLTYIIMKTKHTPLVSIIVPIYNVEVYLDECLQSLLNQTLEAIEIICINDGSTDNSAHIAEQYARKDNRIHLIHKKNQGLSAARNTGLEYVTTEYILFCDSDDYFAPTMCEKMFTAITKHNVDIVVCGTSVLYETKDDLFSQENDARYFTIENECKAEINPELIHTISAPVWNKIFKKSILDSYSIRYIEGKNYEDNFFTPAYLSVANNIYYLPDDLYYYRRRNNSITHRDQEAPSSNLLDILYQVQALFPFFKNNAISTEYISTTFWKIYSLSLTIILKTLPEKDIHKALQIAGEFIEIHKETIKPDTPHYNSKKLFLLGKYKNSIIGSIPIHIRCKKLYYHTIAIILFWKKDYTIKKEKVYKKWIAKLA